mmetsp:Transcript_20374/g.58934  ORF Transcript_20374/g.58934 Transcript_20374/m.58934 type:complete len:203 (-) Transcript_20374:477-1085(-)
MATTRTAAKKKQGRGGSDGTTPPRTPGRTGRTADAPGRTSNGVSSIATRSASPAPPGAGPQRSRTRRNRSESGRSSPAAPVRRRSAAASRVCATLPSSTRGTPNGDRRAAPHLRACRCSFVPRLRLGSSPRRRAAAPPSRPPALPQPTRRHRPRTVGAVESAAPSAALRSRRPPPDRRTRAPGGRGFPSRPVPLRNRAAGRW